MLSLRERRTRQRQVRVSGPLRDVARDMLLPTQRFWVAHIAFVERDIILRQVARIHHEVTAPQVKIDTYVELFAGSNLRELSQRNVRRLSALKAKNISATGRFGITDIDNRLVDLCSGIANRAKNASPVRIAAAPTRFHERTVGNGARSCFRVAHVARALHT